MKLKTYFRSLINTFTAPSYYVDILNARLSFSIRFFLISYVFLSLIATLFFFTFDVPFFKAKLHSATAELVHHFPDNLQISWNLHQLSSTSAEPVEIEYPSFVPHDQLSSVLGYIDTSTSSVEEVLPKTAHSSLFIATRDQVFISNSDKEWSGLPYTQVPGFNKPFQINKQNIESMTQSILNFIDRSLSAIAIFMPFVFFLFLVIGGVFAALTNSILIFFVLRLLMRKRFGYWKAFQLSLHFCVVAELVSMITARLFPNNDLSMFSLAFWGYAIIILYSFRNLQSVILVPKSKS